MASILIAGFLAFLGGTGISILNSRLTRHLLETKPNAFAGFTVIRQGINIAYLVILFFLQKLLPCGVTELLVGGVIGVTLPSIFLAYRMAGEVAKKEKAAAAARAAAAEELTKEEDK